MRSLLTTLIAILLLSPSLSLAQVTPDSGAAPAAKAPATEAPAAKAASEPATKAAEPGSQPAAGADTKLPDPPKGSPTDVPEALGTAKGIWTAFKGGKWRSGVAAIIVLLVFIWRRFLHTFIIGKVSSWWAGFIVVLLSYVGSVPEALAAEPFKWTVFVWSGLLTSAQAMLLWQMVGKKVLPKVFGEPEKPA